MSDNYVFIGTCILKETFVALCLKQANSEIHVKYHTKNYSTIDMVCSVFEALFVSCCFILYIQKM
jgi:hypothetical protein